MTHKVSQSGNFTIAFVADEHPQFELTELSEYAADLFVKIQRCIEDNEVKRSGASALLDLRLSLISFAEM